MTIKETKPKSAEQEIKDNNAMASAAIKSVEKAYKEYYKTFGYYPW